MSLKQLERPTIYSKPPNDWWTMETHSVGLIFPAEGQAFEYLKG